MKKEFSNILEKIWKLRDFVQNLEDIKEEIINHLKILKDLDDSTRNIWISDVNEFFYGTVSAWEILTTIAEEKSNLENIDNSKSFLYAARNHLSKIISQLNIFEDPKSTTLIEKTEKAFKECWDAFWVILKKLFPDKKIIKPTETVIKISDLEYHLPCSVCGKTAVNFKIGYGRLDEKESLVFRGITLETSLNVELAELLFKILQNDDLLNIHNFMKKYHSFEGMDAYCPECDKIYCWEHYNAWEEYDDGFYDCTYGECPKGHKRMIDD
ncbi:MAG: hypothetical protein ACW98D_06945 [Promethearchaeota archaeon]|jgi:hypothetical protein